jgi:hypothetical protein
MNFSLGVAGQIVTRVFLASLAIYFFVMTTVFSYLAADYFIPAQDPIALELFEKVIKPADQLKYTATFRRNKACRAEIQRFIVSRSAGEPEAIGYRDSIIGIITQGDDDLVKTVSVMGHPPLAVGKYALRVYVISQCSLITRIDHYPEAPFEVIETP